MKLHDNGKIIFIQMFDSKLIKYKKFSLIAWIGSNKFINKKNLLIIWIFQKFSKKPFG